VDWLAGGGYLTRLESGGLLRSLLAAFKNTEQFTARGNDSWGLDEVRPMGGMRGGQPVPRVLPMYAVADIADAVVRVREAGGTATEVAQRPYGQESECTDDQGTPFYLGQF